MIQDILISLVSLLLGFGGTYWYLRRPKKFGPEDQISGSIRYQEHKKKKKLDG